MSENAKEEEPPRENEAFDYSAVPKRFYFEVETVGSVSPQEVVMKVRICNIRVLGVKPTPLFRDSANCKLNSRI